MAGPADRSPIDAATSNRAYTLIELVVALAMATFFILTALTIADRSIESYRAQERVSDAQQSLRAALDLMVRDIRMAGYDPLAVSKGPTAGIGIVEATDTQLQFTADLNADRIVGAGREDLTYFYEAESKRLRQREGGKAWAQTFIENVSALKFAYLDASGNTATGLNDIAMVVITLTVEDRYKQGDIFKRTLSTRINCRNLRMSGG